jgi:RNA polymerase sigma-70 factor (ECF subfamily)
MDAAMQGPPTLPSEDPDAVVVSRIRGGETHLFELLMRRHNERVFRVARAIVADGGEAEDVMQDAYVRAFAALDRFEGRSRFSTWLTSITIHEALARKRHARAQSDGDVEHLMDPARGPADVASAAELRPLLEAAIDRLDDPFRLVFVLRAVEQLSVREVAECLAIDEATVKTRYFRARATLKGLLAEHAEGEAPHLFDFPRQRCDRVVARVMQRIDHP